MNFRIRLLSVLVLLFGLLLIGRLYYVQILHGESFANKGDRQYVKPNSTVFDRGSIYFTTKDGEKISGATLKTGYIVAINPSILSDSEYTYEKLSEIIEVQKDEFFLRAGKINDPYEEVADRIPEDLAKRIKDLDIEGLDVFKERWRFYPGEDMASHTLGIIAYSGDQVAGRYGLERYYEQTLGRGDGNLYVNFFAEIFSNINKSISYSKENKGSLVTSIEPTVEAYLEEVLDDIKNDWNGDLIGGIIINPQNGEIIAMDSYPRFNPNDFSGEDISAFSNPLVENVYEMGSIVKPITIAIGLDTGSIDKDTTYHDKGYLVLNESRIQNYDGKGRGVVPVQEILNESLNTGAAFVALEVGSEKFREYMYSFGFGEASGIDLPSDARGLVNNLESNRDIEHATASYGQGVAITPISMVRALSVLANGGKLVTPHLGTKIEYDLGFSKEIEYGEPVRVIKESTGNEISRMLTGVVDEALLDGEVALEHYSVAAKTGTAQIADPVNGGYYEDRYLHTFFGYFPSYDPKFLVFLFNKHPIGARYASETLTHPFFDIADFLINYYDIAPDR
ncbi:MAG: penicillin-binding protein 2 [Candidatus Pacebacteria bacterium]|nr:penicillin-binding protein 2 [Candidatus Paceibacterota bacterium]